MFKNLNPIMMNILDRIISFKKQELLTLKANSTEADLRQSKYYHRTCLSLSKNLMAENATGIIAEFKRKSPSKGFIHEGADAAYITAAYTQFGASGLSILTDEEFFGGSTADLLSGRENDIPILRKDFIIDPYQILAAKAMGADVILLIAACLSPAEVKNLSIYAKNLGLEVLLELHDPQELDHICDEVHMVGINNRNLKTFEVDIDQSLRLAEQIPADKVKVAESGINSTDTIRLFRESGFKGFLIGEMFMKAPDPGDAFRLFIADLHAGT
jgi:indole-3-glycerol phosphate synthase